MIRIETAAMTVSPSSARAAVALTALALALSACQTAKPPSTPVVVAQPPAPLAPVATPGLPPRERLRKAIDLLGSGQRAQARAEVVQLLVDQPGSKPGRKLLDQIDKDPRVLLGERNYPYKVRPGETMSVLADRFLGDPILFYGLARYNNIDAPAQMVAGQTLLIPGVPKKAPPPRPAAKPAEAAPAVAGAGRNPARANQLRGMALEDMNRGAIDRAVARLRLALTFDPDSLPIKRELERALRIHAAVRGK